MTETTSYTLSKIMRNWVEYRVWWWFRNVSNTVYKNSKLVSFEADWKQYTLWYEWNKLSKVSVWDKEYTIKYNWFKVTSIQEN